jgi:hypothetical protein
MRYIVVFDDPNFSMDNEATKEKFRLEVVTTDDIMAGLHVNMNAPNVETQKWALIYKMFYLYLRFGLWNDTRRRE